MISCDTPLFLQPVQLHQILSIRKFAVCVKEAMSSEIVNLVQSLVGVATLIVAIVSIFIGLRAERRNSERFSIQMQHAEDMVAASIRPLVSVYSQVYKKKKSLILCNRGLGPAIVTLGEFSKNGRTTNNVKDLFEFDVDIPWDSWRKLTKGTFSVAPGQEIVLLKLSEATLKSREFSESQAVELLESWQNQKTGIEVRIDYQDAVGRVQETYKATLA